MSELGIDGLRKIIWGAKKAVERLYWGKVVCLSGGR